MSCGSSTCKRITAIAYARGPEPAWRGSRLWRIWLRCGAVLDRAKRRRVWIELEKMRQRRILLDLDDRLLKDIGLTREQAMQEAHKPFWKYFV